MPTISELKEQLKELGVKGYSGKKKAELIAMLEQATAPIPKRKKPIVASFPEQASVSVPKRKRPTVASFPKPEEKEEKKEKLRQPTPPPIIPNVVKKSMIDKLGQDYDTHQYKVGTAHPIDDMIKWFRKVMEQERFWGKNIGVANTFIIELIKWVKNNSHEARAFPWNDDSKEQVLLVDDWDNFFRANK